MKLYECISLPETCISSVWEVKFEDGRYQLHIMDRDFTIERVIKFIKVHYSGDFRVRPISVGAVEIKSLIDGYWSDSRWVTSKLDIYIELPGRETLVKEM